MSLLSRAERNGAGGRWQIAYKHENLIRQFQQYEQQIRKLAASSPEFDDLATEYETLREKIHELEASGDIGPDYTDLCNRRDDLQETLVVMMQKTGSA